jgi:hypothetical protein
MNPTYEHHRPYDGCDLYRGDALDVLPLLAEEGITADMVLSDPPYGTTHCRWDAVIDIPGMWNAVQGISRPDTPVLLFCQHPFTSLFVLHRDIFLSFRLLMAGTQHLAPGKSRVLFPVGGDIRLVAVEYLPCVETDGLQGDLRAGAFTAVQPSGLEIQPDAYIYFLFSLWCHIFSGLDE